MPSIYDWTKYAMYISSIVQLGANRDLVWQWNITGIFTEIFQEIFQEIMSSINQEFLPLYRIQSFRKICRYAPFFDKGLHLSINLAQFDASDAAPFFKNFYRNLPRIFGEYSKNLFFSFFFFLFFYWGYTFLFFFRVLKLKVFMLFWIRRKVHALFLRNINIVLSSDLNALKIVDYSRD